MMIGVWGAALLVYLVFRLWYDGMKKPLTPNEIESIMQLLHKQSGGLMDAEDLAVCRRFMEDDDGKEFIMVNLIKLNKSPVKHPDSGKDRQAIALLTEYMKPFFSSILLRAGHPVISLRGVGGYLDAWNTPPDPGWHGAGLVRYRSRRDALLSSFANPDFAAMHKYKIAALKQTFAFPAQTEIALYASPRLTVALVLALAASLLQTMLG